MQMTDDHTFRQIIDAVDRNFDKQMSLTSELVQIPSQRGEEDKAQEFMARIYADRGLAVDHWKVDVEDIRHMRGFSPVGVSYDRAFNTVGTWHPTDVKGRSLIVNGHIDVVPVGPLGRWGFPPYEPFVKDGWLHGRGAGDMKAGLVAGLAAFDAIKDAGFVPTAPIHFQSVIEEECGGNGALACVQRGYRADAAVVPEPMPFLMRAQVGPMWFSVHLHGTPAHASGAFTGGSNAIEQAFSIIQCLKDLENKWNACKRETAWFKDHPHPIRFNIGGINGGEWTSSVPAECVLHVRCAIYPGWDLAQARAEIVECIARAAQADVTLEANPPDVRFDDGFQAEGYALEPGSDAEEIFRACHETVTGQPLAEEATSAATDARFFGLYQDTPAIVYGPLSRNIHSFNEAVNIESVRQVTRTLALYIAKWCGIQKA